MLSSRTELPTRMSCHSTLRLPGDGKQSCAAVVVFEPASNEAQKLLTLFACLSCSKPMVSSPHRVASPATWAKSVGSDHKADCKASYETDSQETTSLPPSLLPQVNSRLEFTSKFPLTQTFDHQQRTGWPMSIQPRAYLGTDRL